MCPRQFRDCRWYFPNVLPTILQLSNDRSKSETPPCQQFFSLCFLCVAVTAVSPRRYSTALCSNSTLRVVHCTVRLVRRQMRNSIVIIPLCSQVKSSFFKFFAGALEHLHFFLFFFQLESYMVLGLIPKNSRKLAKLIGCTYGAKKAVGRKKAIFCSFGIFQWTNVCERSVGCDSLVPKHVWLTGIA